MFTEKFGQFWVILGFRSGRCKTQQTSQYGRSKICFEKTIQLLAKV